jgi:hypothetical protein
MARSKAVLVDRALGEGAVVAHALAEQVEQERRLDRAAVGVATELVGAGAFQRAHSSRLSSTDH